MKNVKKKVSTILLSGLVIGSLAGCGSSTSSVDNGESKVKLAGDTTVVRSNGVNPLMSPDPTVYLEQGKAKVEVKVKDSDKNTNFYSSLFEHVVGSGSTSSLSTLSGKGNYSDKEEIDVPKSGYYDIDATGGDGDGQVTENSGKFNGNWEVTVMQKPQKDDKYDNRLHMALVDQSVGGEIKSKLTDAYSGEGYTEGVKGFRVNGQNSVSFLNETDDEVTKSTLTDAKWSSKEKEISSDDFYDNHPDAESITEIRTSKGGAEIAHNNGDYYLVFDDTTIKPKKVSIPSKIIEEIKSNRDYWDVKEGVIYLGENKQIDSDNDGIKDIFKWYLTKYDVKENKYILNDKNKKTLVKLPFDPEDANYATDENGNLFVVNGNAPDSYEIEAVAFNKDFKQITKVVKLDTPYADKDETIAIAAYDNRLDIWSMYDARVLTNLDYSNPLNIGVNRYTLTLE